MLRRHARGDGGEAAAYVAFGRSQGWMSGFTGQYTLMDVHGAGSQRSDPKAGDPRRFPHGRGPQGDVIEIYNFVRPVRGGQAEFRESGPELQPQSFRPRPEGPGPAGATRGGPPPKFVDRLDRDGDGRVSRREFDGPAHAFGQLDANKDGYLTQSERPMGRPPGRRRAP